MAKEQSGVDEITPAKERLLRLGLLGRCLVATVSRGRAVRVPASPKVIVVVLTGKLGDVVCGTPVVRAVRKHFPQVRLIAAGGAILKPVLEHSGLCDDYLNVDAPDAEERIRALKPDAALLCGPSFLPLAYLYLGGTPLITAPEVRGGYSPIAQAWPYRILRRLVATYPYTMGEYAPRERLRALEPLGIVEEDTTKELGYSDAARAKAVELLPEGKFLVGISATAGNKIKEWPAERFAQVADHLAEKQGATVVLIGGPEDAKKVGEVVGSMRHREGLINVQGKLTVDELKALISRLNLFIAVDTGPVYIAEAFGVPTIDIVGPMDENEQPPRGSLHRSVVPPYKRKPQLRILNAREYDTEEAERQTLSITAETVIAQTDGLIATFLRSQK